MESKKELILYIGWAVTTVALLVALVVIKRIPTLETGEDIFASINGKDFTVNEFYNELKTQGGYTTLNKLVDQYIISQEITDNTDAVEYADSQYDAYVEQYSSSGYDFETVLKQNGYTKESFLNDIMYNYNQNIVAENYIKSNFTDEEIKKYYESSIYEELTVRHILIKSTATSSSTTEEKTAAESEALKKAEDLIKKLNDGANFEELAKEYSEDDGTKASGGLYSNFTQENTDSAFFKAANALKDGEYTKTPVKSQYGYHVILKVSNNGKPALDKVQDKVLDGLLDDAKEKDENAINKAWVALRKKYNLTINDDEIKSVYDSMVDTYK